MIEEKPVHKKGNSKHHFSPSEVLAKWAGEAQLIGYLYGNALECISRFNAPQPSRDDLAQAKNYLQRLYVAISGEEYGFDDGTPRVHYAEMDLEPIHVMPGWMTAEQYVGYIYGCVIKYVGRFNCNAPGKGGQKDIWKAIDYLERLIELECKE